MNDNLNVGDRIRLINMDGIYIVPPNTEGTVTNITDDLIDDGKIVKVSWDNGSNLRLLTNTDKWVKINKLQEAKIDGFTEFLINNPMVRREYISVSELREIVRFLYDIRDSGIINMLSASNILFAGEQYIDRYYGETEMSETANIKYESVLSKADKIRDIGIRTAIKFLESKNKEVSVDSVTHAMKKLSISIVNMYIGGLLEP